MGFYGICPLVMTSYGKIHHILHGKIHENSTDGFNGYVTIIYRRVWDQNHDQWYSTSIASCILCIRYMIYIYIYIYIYLDINLFQATNFSGKMEHLPRCVVIVCRSSTKNIYQKINEDPGVPSLWFSPPFQPMWGKSHMFEDPWDPCPYLKIVT